MKPENSINYYYAVQALRLLVERGLLSETEEYKASRLLAGNIRPGRGHTEAHWVWTSTPNSRHVRGGGERKWPRCR